MPDDRRSRIDESTRYLDGQYDKTRDEADSAAKQAAFYKALLRREHGELRRIAGVPPAAEPDAVGPETPRESTQDLRDRVRSAFLKASRAIEHCRHLPPELRADWLGRLGALDEGNYVAESERLHAQVKEIVERKSLRPDQLGYRELKELREDLDGIEFDLLMFESVCFRYSARLFLEA
jgi:hypothetical protein